MNKLSLVLIAILFATIVIVPAVPVQASTGTIEEIPVTLAPSDPCGGGQYPNANPFVVVEWVCHYVGTHGAQITTAKYTPCYVMNQSTCRNGTPKQIAWKSYADVEFAQSTVSAGRILARLCNAHLIYLRDTLTILGQPTEDLGPVCDVLLTAGSITAGCVYAGNITAYFQAYAAELEQAGRTVSAAVVRSIATSWAAATASICSLPTV